MVALSTRRALLIALMALSATPAVADGGAAPTGPLAIFWGGARTWLVDVDRKRLLVAPGWLVPGPAGPTRYRMRRVAEPMPRGADGLPSASHRWTRFERLDPGARRWTALTISPELPAEGQLFDEQHVVQFAGDRVALMRSRRVRTGALTDDRISGLTLELPGGAARPAPPDIAPALGWLKRTLPGLIEPCVDRPAGLLALDTPGGVSARWLVLTGLERCADRAHGLTLDRPPGERAALSGARWVGQRFEPDVGPALTAVVDVRPTADGRTALLLSGAPLPAGRLLHRDLARFDDPCTTRDLTLWRAGRTAPLGKVSALNGARWLAVDDPFRAQIDHWFTPATAPPCHRPLAHDATPPTGRLCQMVEDGRAWAGPDDLAVSAWAEPGQRRLVLHVAVHDPDRTGEDGVELYLGPGRRPKRAHLGPEGLEIRGGRKTRRIIARQLDGRWTPTRAGYRARFTIDRRLLGRPAAISVRVDDVDPDAQGAVRAWPVGVPIDGRNPRATPMEAAP